MVLVEDLEDDEVAPLPKQASEPKKKTELKKGFLDTPGESLYGPEGSPEGVVAPETHKAHTEHKLNKEINEGMNRGAKENNGFERPSWYTKEWPKDCQYNSPGCNLNEMDHSSHRSDIHRGLVRDGIRWKEALAPGVTEIRLSFSQMCDEDVAELVRHLKGNKDVKEIDLSHNSIKDVGIQTLVAALCAGAAPNLKELRVYSNEFTELGQTMLTQGLKILRKKVEVHWEEPAWAKAARAARAEVAAKEAQQKEEQPTAAQTDAAAEAAAELD